MSFAHPPSKARYIPHVAQLLLDLPDRFEIRRPLERVSAHQEQLDQVPRDVPSGHIEPSCKVGQGESFIDGHDMGDSVSRVDDDSGCETCGPDEPTPGESDTETDLEHTASRRPE